MTVIGERTRSRRNGNFRRPLTAGVAAATLAVVFAAPATAAQPNHRACLGEDVRAYARGGAEFGGFVASVLAEGGAGAEIQAHLAGDVPDELIPNSCND